MRIVALGDSTTAGTPGFLSPVEAPPHGSGDVTSQYAYWLMQEHPGWEVLNRGVNRERTDQIAARFDRDVLAARPDVVVIVGGVNDIYDGWGAAHAIAQLRTMYERAHGAGIAVVAGTILPFNTATPLHHAMAHAVNDWIRSVREGTSGSFAVADTRAAVARPDDPDRLASTPDGLHPNVEGYRAMAVALAPAIERVARERVSPRYAR
jgi:lysophospholipase L1-like esterase